MGSLSTTRLASAPVALMAAILVGLTLIQPLWFARGGEPMCALSVDPVSGPYDTTEFALGGSGFAPVTSGALVVSWTDSVGELQSQDYPVTTDAAGDFGLDIFGPAALPEDYSATAEMAGCLASATFSTTVAPCRRNLSLTVVPAEPRGGEPFTVLGAGWTFVDVRVVASGLGEFAVTPDPAGAFELVLTTRTDMAGATVDVSARELIGADEILVEDCHAATQFVLRSPIVTLEPTQPAPHQLPDTALAGPRSVQVAAESTNIAGSAAVGTPHAYRAPRR